MAAHGSAMTSENPGTSAGSRLFVQSRGRIEATVTFNDFDTVTKSGHGGATEKARRKRLRRESQIGP
jgi:hypothetical protein